MPDRDQLPSMSEDRLRDHLRGLYNDALAHVRPPGVDVVRRRAHRRVATHAAAFVVVLVATVVAALVPSWWGTTADLPAAPPTSATTSGSATPGPTASTPPTTSSSTPGDAEGTSAGQGEASGDECVPGGVVDVTELMNNGYTSVSLRLPEEHPDWEGLLCPGEKVRVLWASYTVDPAGVQHLYRFEERILDAATPTWRMYVEVRWEGLCGPTWYVSKGNDTIPATIPLGGSAFPNKFHWADENAKPGCDPTPIPP